MTEHNPRGSCPVGFNRANFAEFVLSLVNQSTDFPRQSKILSVLAALHEMINMFREERPTCVYQFMYKCHEIFFFVFKSSGYSIYS